MLQIRFTTVAEVCAESDAAGAQQCSLLRGPERAGMPARVAQIQPEIDPRKNDINVAPPMHAERNAIGRRSVDAICIEAVEVNTFKAQWSRRRNRMSHRRLFHIGGDNSHFSERFTAFANAAIPGL